MSQKESALFSLTTEMTPKIDEGDKAFSLRSRDYKDPQCVIEIEKEVEVRKYEVDKERLIECLQSHRTMSIREIATKLNKPKTLVEHWFRKDKCFAIPDPDIWFDLKKILGIETNEFDESITTFETKAGSYDMANRIYIGETSPTLTASSENNLYAFKKMGHAKSKEDGQGWKETEINDTLNAFDDGETRTPTLVTQVFENHAQDSRFRPLGEICQTVSATYGMGGNNQPLVVEPKVFDGSRRHDYRPFGDVNETIQAQYGTGGNNTPLVVEQEAKTIYGQEITGTIVSSMTSPSGSTQDNNVIVTETYQKTTGALCASGYDKLGTQEATNDMYVVQSSWDGSQTSPTLTANNAGGEQRMPDKDNFNAVIEKDTTQSVVRRLTPKECERLQGFPDDHTNIGEWIDTKGKKHKDADSPRYKALGNSIALPFWEWLAERIINQLKEDGKEQTTMASLFDGIGGFPLVFSRHGCEPVWASEIEEFPIAVTKIRFPEKGEEHGK